MYEGANLIAAKQWPMVSCKTRGRCESQSPRPVPALLTDTEIGRAGAPPANSLPPRARGESDECAGSGTGGKTWWRIGSQSTGVDATSDSERPSGAPVLAPSPTETLLVALWVAVNAPFPVDLQS